MIQEWFWGTTLSKDAKEYLWSPTFSEVDESCASVDTEEAFEKSLLLSSVVVSPDATNGEVQEIEVVAKDSNEKDVTVTVAVLVAGSLYQTPLSVELPQVAVIIRLKRGDGPVYLAGKEFLARDGDPEVDVEEEALEEESEVEEAEKVTNDSCVKAAHKVDAKKRKKPESNGKLAASASARAKRTKLETKHNSTDDDPEDEEMEDEDEEELDETDEDNSEEELPPAKAKKGKKVVAVKKAPPPAKAGKAALMKKVPVAGAKKTAKAKA